MPVVVVIQIFVRWTNDQINEHCLWIHTIWLLEQAIEERKSKNSKVNKVLWCIAFYIHSQCILQTVCKAFQVTAFLQRQIKLKIKIQNHLSGILMENMEMQKSEFHVQINCKIVTNSNCIIEKVRFGTWSIIVIWKKS